jgi:hypothetical protein
MSSYSKYAILKQDMPSKVPALLTSNLNPTVMRAYKNACLSYFENKEITADKQVHKILAGLRDD